MSLYYISARTNPGITTATSLDQLNELMADAADGAADTTRLAAIVPGEQVGDALVKFTSLFPNVNTWLIDQIPTFQVAIIEGKYASFLNRSLTSKEVAEVNAVSSGQPWDPEAYDQVMKDRADASAMLSSLLASGELPPGFNPDNPSDTDLDDTDEDSVGDAN